MKKIFLANKAIFDFRISEHAKITYLYLEKCIYCKEPFPSYATIAQNCNFSRGTAIKAIKELERDGLIDVEKRYLNKNKKKNISNFYILNLN